MPGCSATHRPAKSGTNQQHESDRARLEHAPGANPAKMDAHEQGDRDGEPDRHDAPRARCKRIHHDEREHGDQHDHDAEYGDERRRARNGADLVPRHCSQRTTVAPNGGKQDDEILHGASEHDARNDPDRAGEKAELRGERRTNQRSRPRNGREVVAEHHPSIRREIVATILEPNRRCRRADRRLERSSS